MAESDQAAKSLLPTQLLAEVCGGGLAHVVDQNHGDIELALEGAQRTEDRGDLLGRVLVDINQTYKWIRAPRGGAEEGNRPVKAVELVRVVKAERGQVDEVDRGVLQDDAAGLGHRLEAGRAWRAGRPRRRRRALVP